MTKALVPFATPDVSALAKSLKTLLDARHARGLGPPSHLEMLNLLARAAGQRNFATLKASASKVAAGDGSAAPSPVQPAAPKSKSDAPADNRHDLSALSPTVRKALMQFDEAGRMVRMPNKLAVRQVALWALWTRFVVRRRYTEREINAIISAHHTFADHATLRRELINFGLLARRSDCSEYWKQPQRPNAEVQGFLRAWRAGQR